MNRVTTFNHNLKPARLAFLAVLMFMLITLVAAVRPAAAQSSPESGLAAAESDAVPLVSPKGGVQPNSGVQPATSVGYCTYHISGWYRLTCNWGLINSNSTVNEAISEFANGIPTERFIGSASMQIFNIAPFPGGVTALVYVNWGSPLDVRLDVSVN